MHDAMAPTFFCLLKTSSPEGKSLARMASGNQCIARSCSDGSGGQRDKLMHSIR